MQQNKKRINIKACDELIKRATYYLNQNVEVSISRFGSKRVAYEVEKGIKGKERVFYKKVISLNDLSKGIYNLVRALQENECFSIDEGTSFAVDQKNIERELLKKSACKLCKRYFSLYTLSNEEKKKYRFLTRVFIYIIDFFFSYSKEIKNLCNELNISIEEEKVLYKDYLGSLFLKPLYGFLHDEEISFEIKKEIYEAYEEGSYFVLDPSIYQKK